MCGDCPINRVERLEYEEGFEQSKSKFGRIVVEIHREVVEYFRKKAVHGKEVGVFCVSKGSHELWWLWEYSWKKEELRRKEGGVGCG